MRVTNYTTIYVGLNDAITHEQRFETEKYLSILRHVCKSYNVAFSVNRIDGGYIHEDGTYVEETSLALTLVDIPKETVDQIAVDLCTFFRQESVMVVDSPAGVYFLSANIEE